MSPQCRATVPVVGCGDLCARLLAKCGLMCCRGTSFSLRLWTWASVIFILKSVYLPYHIARLNNFEMWPWNIFWTCNFFLCFFSLCATLWKIFWPDWHDISDLGFFLIFLKQKLIFCYFNLSALQNVRRETSWGLLPNWLVIWSNWSRLVLLNEIIIKSAILTGADSYFVIYDYIIETFICASYAKCISLKAK